MKQAEIEELMSAGITKGKADIAELVTALKATLWVLEHPEANAINFCGNLVYLALEIRALLAKHERPNVANEAGRTAHAELTSKP